MARLRASWRTSLPVVQQPRNPQSESIARSPYHTPHHRIGALARFRVTFAKELMDLRFPIASVEVRHARDVDRALRVAELKFSRHYGIDWRMRADVRDVEAV